MVMMMMLGSWSKGYYNFCDFVATIVSFMGGDSFRCVSVSHFESAYETAFLISCLSG